MSEHLKRFPFRNFAETAEEKDTYAGVLIFSGNVRELLLYGRAVGRTVYKSEIKTCLNFAKEKLAVADYLFGIKMLNASLTEERMFSLANDCVVSGKLIGLKALEQHGFRVRPAQKHTTISQKLIIVTGGGGRTPNFLEQKYGYLKEWVDIITKGRGWQNEEEREYAYKILHEAALKDKNPNK